MLAFAIHYCGMVVVVVVVVVVVGWIILSNTIDKFFVVPSHSFYFTFYGARGESFSEGCKCPSENALAHFSLISLSYFANALPYFVTSSHYFVTSRLHHFITSRHVEVDKEKVKYRKKK